MIGTGKLAVTPSCQFNVAHKLKQPKLFQMELKK